MFDSCSAFGFSLQKDCLLVCWFVRSLVQNHGHRACRGGPGMRIHRFAQNDRKTWTLSIRRRRMGVTAGFKNRSLVRLFSGSNEGTLSLPIAVTELVEVTTGWRFCNKSVIASPCQRALPGSATFGTKQSHKLQLVMGLLRRSFLAFLNDKNTILAFSMNFKHRRLGWILRRKKMCFD